MKQNKLTQFPTSDPYKPLLTLTDNIILKSSDKYVALSNVSLYYTWKYKKVVQDNKW